MAGQRINFATINATTIDALSCYNVAHNALKVLRENYKSESDKIAKAMDKVRENRKNDIDAGIPVDEVTRKWSLEEYYEQQRALDVRYESDCKPHKESQRECLKWVDENLYYGYVLAQKKGSLNCKGSIEIKKGKKVETIELSKSYSDMLKDFLVNIGCSKTDNESALNKFAQVMATRTSGMVQCNKGENYVKEKSASQYNKLFMLNFLQYLVVEKGILVENENHELSMKQYN